VHRIQQLPFERWLYLDTSVIGGYYDAEFMVDTRALWRLHASGRFIFASSIVAGREALGAPRRVRLLMRATFAQRDLLPLSEAADELTAAYLAQGVVSRKYADDAFHVAICTLARIEFLVSWNFRHLANVRREAGFNEVNFLQGHPPVRIVTPRFFIHGQEEKSF
jgi:hypothetical protein